MRTSTPHSSRPSIIPTNQAKITFFHNDDREKPSVHISQFDFKSSPTNLHVLPRAGLSDCGEHFCYNCANSRREEISILITTMLRVLATLDERMVVSR